MPVDEEEIVKENIGMRRNREIGSFLCLELIDDKIKLTYRSLIDMI